jgi:prepilin-type N-terminal cleavage/methylation domain-containing protein
MHIHQKHKAAGFTLMELMIVISIFSILITPFVFLEVYSTEGLYTNIRRQQMTESGNRVVEWIARDFRSCKGLRKEWRSEELSEDRLILSAPDTGVIIYGFHKEKRTITRKQYTGKGHRGAPIEMAVATHVDRFSFKPVDVGARLIRIKIDLSREMLHSRERVTVNGTAWRRIP